MFAITSFADSEQSFSIAAAVMRYGKIGQETTGAGGFAKALRSVPVILDICHDMERLCPDAFLINFANPSGILTEAALSI